MEPPTLGLQVETQATMVTSRMCCPVKTAHAPPPHLPGWASKEPGPGFFLLKGRFFLPLLIRGFFWGGISAKLWETTLIITNAVSIQLSGMLWFVRPDWLPLLTLVWDKTIFVLSTAPKTQISLNLGSDRAITQSAPFSGPAAANQPQIESEWKDILLQT